MIEGILRESAPTFAYGTVNAVDPVQQKAQVRLRSDLLVWIQTSLILSIGDTVILGRNDNDSSRFIVQYSEKLIPSQGMLILI